MNGVTKRQTALDGFQARSMDAVYYQLGNGTQHSPFDPIGASPEFNNSLAHLLDVGPRSGSLAFDAALPRGIVLPGLAYLTDLLGVVQREGEVPAPGGPQHSLARAQKESPTRIAKLTDAHAVRSFS